MPTHVRTEIADHVAVLTLDGPETLNAFSSATGAGLSAAYRTCDADPDVRAIVLTGAGRAFCAGADLGAHAASFAAPGDEFSASPVRPAAFELGTPVIAAINGPAIGIGFTLALQCDVRYVAEDAKLSIPQVRFGMLGDAHSHGTLPRIAGLGTAAELLLSGRTLTGAEAAARGLASAALPAAEVLGAALELAREIAATAHPEAVALSKRILWSGFGAEEVERAETDAHRRLMAGPDAQAAAAAWREARTTKPPAAPPP